MIYTTLCSDNLLFTRDVIPDENGEPKLDEANQPICTGYKILQNETGRLYNSAYDVPSKGYTYSETNIPIKEE